MADDPPEPPIRRKRTRGAPPAAKVKTEPAPQVAGGRLRRHAQAEEPDDVEYKVPDKKPAKKPSTKKPAAKKPTAKKAKKDPNKPKGACSAYIFFSSAMRPKLKKDGDSIGDVAKKCGDAWGKLSEKDKAPYVKKAAADKARYQKEMASYKPKK